VNPVTGKVWRRCFDHWRDGVLAHERTFAHPSVLRERINNAVTVLYG